MRTHLSSTHSLIGRIKNRANSQKIILSDVLRHLTQAFKNLALLGNDNNQQSLIRQINAFNSAERRARVNGVFNECHLMRHLSKQTHGIHDDIV